MLKELYFGLTLGVKTLFLPCTSTYIDKSSLGAQEIQKTNKNQVSIRTLFFSQCISLTRGTQPQPYSGKINYFLKTLSHMGLSENFPTPWFRDGL